VGSLGIHLQEAEGSTLSDHFSIISALLVQAFCGVCVRRSTTSSYEAVASDTIQMELESNMDASIRS